MASNPTPQSDKTVECVDIYGDTYQVLTDQLRWRPSAYGIVIRGNEILLCKHFGKYNLPGGGLDLGEKPEAAVIREVKEETGIDVANPQLVGLDSDFFKLAHSDSSTVQSILIYYVCDYVGGQLSMDAFDEDEKRYSELAEWVSLDKLDSLEITSSKDYRQHIARAISRRQPSQKIEGKASI